MFRRTALAAASVLTLLLASIAGSVSASAAPALRSAASTGSPVAGYITHASPTQQQPAEAFIEFAVPIVKCTQATGAVSVWTGLYAPAQNFTAEMGIEAQCKKVSDGRGFTFSAAYNAFFEMNNGQDDSRQTVPNAKQRFPADDRLPVKAGNEIEAWVDWQPASQQYAFHVYNRGLSAGISFSLSGSTAPSSAECMLDAGALPAQQPLAPFTKGNVTTCTAGPFNSTTSRYGKGYLALNPNSTKSVHELWGWGVAKRNLVSPTGTVLAVTSNPVAPTQTKIGNFTVTWKAAS